MAFLVVVRTKQRRVWLLTPVFAACWGAVFGAAMELHEARIQTPLPHEWPLAESIEELGGSVAVNERREVTHVSFGERTAVTATGEIQCREWLGGLLHYYYRDAA